jgi:hypothetical protein
MLSVRLREYEVDVDRSTSRGPEVERIYFVIIEMARKSLSSALESYLLSMVTFLNSLSKARKIHC